MCIAPVKKINPNFLRGVPTSRQYITFPCGKCAECMESRILSWQVRGFHEYIHTAKAGGHTYFLTFTYATPHIPLMEYSDIDLNLHTISTWNTNHVKNCFKRLRRAFEREYNEHAVIRYLFTCERGSNRFYEDHKGRTRKATERPHYHAIVTINGTKHTYDECLALIRRSWSNYDPATHKRSSYGDVYNEAITRTPEQAIKYVCKYVVKTAQHDRLQKLLPYFVRHNQGLADGKDMLPRMHVSKHFGINDKFTSLLITKDHQPTDYFMQAEVPNPWDKTGNKPSIPLPNYYQHHYIGRTYRHVREGNELKKKWFVKNITSQLSRHRGALVNGYYVDPYTTIETKETLKPLKNLGTIHEEHVRKTRLTTFIQKRIARLRAFASLFPLNIYPYVENEYLTKELLAGYSVTLQRIAPRENECAQLLQHSLLEKYLFYEYTHFPQVKVTPSVIKHRQRVELLHDINEACTFYTNVQKQLTRMQRDDKYKGQLPEQMKEHPELFKTYILS